MSARISKGLSPSPTNSDLFQRYCKKAEIIHHFAENLAQTLGVFNGINETGKALELEGEPNGALSTVLFDQLQIMVVRVCALCDSGTRNDDASLGELVRGLSDRGFQEFLIERENQWVRAVGYRAGPAGEIPKFVRVLKARWSALSAEEDALGRIRHYRNKSSPMPLQDLIPARRFSFVIFGEYRGWH
jgi:hypothetical protein